MSRSTAAQTPQPAPTTPPTRGPRPGARLTDGRVLFLLAAAVLLVYANALGGQFVFDDTRQIVNNSQMRTWANLLDGFTSDVWGFQSATPAGDTPPLYYRPLFTAYLTLGYQLFGLWEPGWHLLSLLAHAAATLLFFRLALLLSDSRRAAGLAAALFAVHPAHVEAVAWATGITDTLAALFYLPSLAWYVRFRREGRRYLLALSVAAFALAVLCKETAIVLPLVLAAWELLFGEGRTLATRLRACARRVAPFLLVAAGYLAARFAVLGRLGWQHPTMVHVSDASLAATVPQIIALYLRHLAAPFDLSLIYDAPLARGFADARFIVPAVILAGLAGALWVFRRGLKREHWFAFVLMGTPLLPVLNLRAFHQEYLIQDRYLYLPSAGFCLLAALLLVRLGRARVTVAAVLLLVTLGASTVWQNRVWAGSVALWSRAVAHAPHQWAPRYNLGLALLAERDYAGARAELRAAAERNPRVAAVQSSLALAEDALGDERAAVEGLERALALDPHLREARNNLGTIHFRRGRYDAAREQFEHALRRDPDAAEVRFNLARALAAAGDHAAALPHFEWVVARDPTDSEGRYHLGLSYAATGRHTDARAQLDRALADERLPHRAAEVRAALEKLRSYQ